jgi:hypothetical protein
LTSASRMGEEGGGLAGAHGDGVSLAGGGQSGFVGGGRHAGEEVEGPDHG